jgi:hypothetical protein
MTDQIFPKISTITTSTQLPYCQLNLTNIGKYLQIDNEIIGLKYNYAELSIMKGTYYTSIYKKSKYKNVDKIKKTLFYNQITIILNNNGNNVNIKLFGNGSLHLTGCKNENDGMDATKIIYNKLKNIIDKKDIILLTKDERGVLIDKDKLVYSYPDKNKEISIIGYKKDISKYIINKKEYTIDNQTKMFISTKIEKKRQRSIINFKGEEIGFSRIELFKNRNKFYKKNINIYIDPCNNFIYYNNTILIGKIEYDINNDKITDIDDIDDILEIEYSCNPFKDDHSNLDQLIYEKNQVALKKMINFNINCINVYFTIDYEINRQRLYEQLISLNYICKYKPESYSGIKFIYKIALNKSFTNVTDIRQGTSSEAVDIRQGTSSEAVDIRQGTSSEAVDIRQGTCSCSDKCTCTNITFLIFQTGNIIATGFKEIYQIDIITKYFLSLCDSLKPIIQKKKFL